MKVKISSSLNSFFNYNKKLYFFYTFSSYKSIFERFIFEIYIIYLLIFCVLMKFLLENLRYNLLFSLLIFF